MASSSGVDSPPLRNEEEEPVASQVSPKAESPPIETETRVSTESNNVDLTTRVFQFLSTATPENLGAIAVGLAAVTYFILGQTGLVIIGAFGGIVVFVQWEARNPEVSRAVKGERGVDVISRVLAFSKDKSNSEDKERDLDEEEQSLARGFDDFCPETRDALNELVDAVIRDYVKWWYTPIVPTDRSFPLSSHKVLTSFLLSVSNHLSRKRPADAFLNFLTNASSIIIVFFSELSAVFAEIPPESKISTSDAVHGYLAANPESSLANLLSQKQQAGKFRMVAEDLLEFLDRPTLDCDPVRVFLREILAGVVLEKTLQTCSSPEWLNSWIVYLLEAGEPDFNQAIDVGMQTRPEANSTPVDADGGVANGNCARGSRNSFDGEKSRRKEQLGHKKQLSKADEEMDEAMEEIKRLNQMIAEDEARRAEQGNGSEVTKGTEEAEERLAGAMQRNADELDIQMTTRESVVDAPITSPGLSDRVSPKSSSSSDELSTNRESLHTPITPRSSTVESTSQNVSPTRNTGSSFTNFDQIVPPVRDTIEEDGPKPKLAPLTLHNCTITIHDESIADKGRIKNKPTWDYLIQIEPATSSYPGWMIVRKYSDFEKLHEVVRRIAAISGATAFSEQHSTLPSWKVHTRSSLRGELERYVRDACWYQPLADSEGMKRFLEKSLGHAPSASKSGLQAFENMGKNMLDVLTNAPKGVAEGGKVLGAGVTGVLGNMGLAHRKSMPPAAPTNSALQDVTSYTNRLSISTPPRTDSGLSVNTTSARKSRDSLDSQRSSVVSTQPGKMPLMKRRPSYTSQPDGDADGLQAGRPDRWDLASPSVRGSRQNSRASSAAAPVRSPSATSLSGIKLPPPPDQMPEDYGSPTRLRDSGVFPNASKDSFDSASHLSLNGAASAPPPVKLSSTRTFSRLSEQETRVAVELAFAIINELYTLSSAWNIRRTLLAAAKSFLLRPGNPSLTSIQSMIQTSVLDANTSDAGLAAHLRKLRENILPTEEELAAWPPESSAEEKEKLRIRARKLLIKSGVPAALMGVMGANATADALGRIFDCLQIEEVSRGLVFGVILQAIRVITH